MNQVAFNEYQLDEIRTLTRDKRQSLGFIGETPIANDIFTILNQLGIMLLEYPIKSDGDRPAFSAAIMYSEERNKTLTFIGLNTADYFDKQIFAIAHELYHFYTKSGSHLSRIEDDKKNTMIEANANRFAAEFLLPADTLKSIIIKQFKHSSISDIPHKTLLRFIARVQTAWWLPYRSIVKRLREINAISLEQHDTLYAIDERDPNGEYGKIGYAIDKETFHKLNTCTRTTGTAANEIEVIIRNFEDNLIDEDKFAETLSLFNRTPDEFGYEVKVSQEDIDELESFFGMGDDDEH